MASISPALFHLRQQFVLGAYQAVVDTPLPDPNSPEYTPSLLYHLRSHLALSRPSLVPPLLSSAQKANPEVSPSTSFSLRAIVTLAKYFESILPGPKESEEDKDAALEELRDLCVEIEGDEDEEDDEDKEMVKVLAATAFANEGEIEEALETLDAGKNTGHLEATALTIHLYLTINRPDLAKKTYTNLLSSPSTPDTFDILLQLLESTLSLFTGSSVTSNALSTSADAYSTPLNFYTEQLANPSLSSGTSSSSLLTARAITRLMKNEVAAAKSDLEEAQQISTERGSSNADELIARIVAAYLAPSAPGMDGAWKKAEEANMHFALLSGKYPSHPYVTKVQKLQEDFDTFASKYTVPPVAVGA